MKDISKKDIENNIPLVCRKDYNREVKARNVVIGGKDLAIMAGPCTVESKGQIFAVAEAIKDSGANMLRGGVFKPLTFPYGDPLGQPDSDSSEPKGDPKKIMSRKDLFKAAEKRLSYLKDAGDKYGLAVISEILYSDSLEMMSQYADMFQIGYRHMFNMDLIETLCRTDKPVMIKRHYGESLRSLLGVAEHFEARGKHNFVFCERGVSVPHTHNIESRAILDIQAIPALKDYAPSVPVIIDPSHATFRRNYVAAMSRAAIAAGADGLLIEVHPDPEHAWVDPLQALGFSDFKKLMEGVNGIFKVVGKN
jgi:3-deoxy-7-phosphoheptulonate synthase